MDIDEFLAAQKATGEVDSQGVFTLAVEKARQKLGKFQLDDPSFYLLKVVQAAVLGGATRIDLRTSRSKLALWFDSSVPLGSFEELLEVLRNPLETRAGPIKLLALGINAGLFSDPPQVSFVWWGAQSSQALVAADQELVMTKAPPRPEGVSASENLYLFSVTKPKAGWFEKSTAKEHAAVCNFCSHAAVDFRVDGRKLEAGPQTAPRAEPWLATYSEPFHLVERIVAEAGGGLRVRVPPGTRKMGRSGMLKRSRLAETFCMQPAMTKAPREIVANRAYALPLALRGADKITFVCHGVKATTVTVNAAGAGATALVSAEGLNFDVSGFGVMRDSSYEAVVESVRDVWKEMARSVRVDLGELKGTVMPEERKETDEIQKQGLGCGCFGCFGGLFLLANLPHLGGDMTVIGSIVSMIAAGSVPFIKSRTDPNTRLQEAVIYRLDQLDDEWH